MWIEISAILTKYAFPPSHFPCGSVDCNHSYEVTSKDNKVTSLAEVWIEIILEMWSEINRAVTSLAEVWIEIVNTIRWMAACFVTSLAEVWIEISINRKQMNDTNVTSLAEVWIEMHFL